MKAQQSSNPALTRQLVTLLAIIVSIIVNTLSNIFPLNGTNIGKLSNTLLAPVQVTPANYAFAIWGVVYLGLIAYGLYQFQSTERYNPRLERGGYLLTIACIFQSVWIYLFLARLFPLSIVAMLGILLSLIALYQCLGIGGQNISKSEKWFLHIPISIYLGWITTATVVNIASTLYVGEWDGWGIPSTVWTVLMMGISAAIAFYVYVERQDRAFLLVIVWALLGIAIRQFGTPLIAVAGVVISIALLLLLANESRFLSR
ncbi:tryptophan-rich sensory protein [Chamaesiphon sp. GL140_3_metabinner_50]|uniref:tryptophan-rich sensory protein n=1 Tax=Chamaesiphon sp. GL140_3_metabinner_50 TaxID=2970812 RepID=UPI0025E3CFCB|nr:tryptophan-rich sensory protein [Chamaesiphon sp. GL140_3_metabinner_50]